MKPLDLSALDNTTRDEILRHPGAMVGILDGEIVRKAKFMDIIGPTATREVAAAQAGSGWYVVPTREEAAQAAADAAAKASQAAGEADAIRQWGNPWAKGNVTGQVMITRDHPALAARLKAEAGR